MGTTAGDLRDRVSAAAHELRQALPTEFTGAPWVVSRFGFDFLEEDQVSEVLWHRPADRVAGLCRTVGPGRGMLALRTCGARPTCFFEWSPLAHEPLEAADEAFPVWLAANLGAPAVLVWCAGMSLHEDPPMPQVVAFADHVQWPPADPLIGWESPGAGPRFPHATRLYRPLSGESGVALVRRGPSAPTPAESRVFRGLGADFVVEGGACEALAARHAGLPLSARAVLLDAVSEENLDPGTLADRAETVLPHLADCLAADLGLLCDVVPEEQL